MTVLTILGVSLYTEFLIISSALVVVVESLLTFLSFAFARKSFLKENMDVLVLQ